MDATQPLTQRLPVDHPHELTPGTNVDQFRIKRLLGRGAMGEVYLARDTKLGRRVALKLIHPELLGSTEAAERLQREARVTATFDHPNIVSIYDVGEYDGRPYVALAYVEGEDLRTRARRQRPTLAEALRHGLAIAKALREAHSHGILHRDLKPANSVVGRDGRLRVVDFGLAVAAERPAASVAPASALLAEGEALLAASENTDWGAGTPAYMAPEQWREHPCSAATDIWALGVILFELCAGQRPYRGDNAVDFAWEVCRDEAAPRLDDCADVPDEVADLVAACLAKAPAERPSAAEVVDELERLVLKRPTDSRGDRQPFKGLLAFTERDAGVFCGRATEIDRFVERLRDLPVMPVVGPSGAGKSSFIQAGVIPRLREQGAWHVIHLRPGSRPLQSLAARLGDDSLAERPRPHRQVLGLVLRELAAAEEANLLLYVDQLEELFTLTEDESERAVFLEAICAAADDPTDPVRVVMSLRDDFLGHVATSAATRDAFDHVMVLEPLRPPQLHEALQRPLAMAGYRFEDDALVDEMVAAVSGSVSGLPLLQFAAARLWDERDQDRRVLLRAAYEAMGGVAGALAAHADGVIARLSSLQVGVARALILRLVTAERTRRVVAQEEALAGLGTEAPRVLDDFIGARLITVAKGTPGQEGRAMLELAHESLIRQWTTLRSWLDESRDDLSFWREIEQAAKLWDKRGRRPDELWRGSALRDALARPPAIEPTPEVTAFLAAGRRQARRGMWLRRGAMLLSVAALAAVAIGAWSYRGTEVEREQQSLAIRRQQEVAAEVDRIIAAAAAEERDVRWIELHTLKLIKLDEPRVRDVLLERLAAGLRHDDDRARRLAAGALGALGGTEALDALIGRLEEGVEPSEDVIIAVINALALFDDDRAELPVRAVRWRYRPGSRVWISTSVAYRLIPLPPVPPEGLSLERWHERGKALDSKGDEKGALAAYERVLSEDPTDIRTLNNRALIYQRIGKTPLAIADYRRALELQPDLAAARYNLAVTLRRLGRYDEAVAEYTKVMKGEGPAVRSALRSRSIARLHLGDTEGALADARGAVAAEPELPLANRILARALMYENRWDEAVETYERAIALAPNDRHAYRQLIALHHMRGDGAAAKRVADDFYSAQPNALTARVAHALEARAAGDEATATSALDYCVRHDCMGGDLGDALTWRAVLVHGARRAYQIARTDLQSAMETSSPWQRRFSIELAAVSMALRDGDVEAARALVTTIDRADFGPWHQAIVATLRGEGPPEEAFRRSRMSYKKCIAHLAAGLRSELANDPAAAREHYRGLGRTTPFEAACHTAKLNLEALIDGG